MPVKKPAGEVEETVDAGDSRYSAIEAAYDAADEGAEDGATPREGAEEAAGDEGDEPVVEEEAGEEEDAEGDDRPRDEQGRFAKKEGEEDAADEEGGAPAPGEGDQAAGAGGDQAAAAAAAGAVAAAAAGGQPAALKAPGSWRPAERDAFDKLTGPEAQVVKAAALRREAQIESALRENEGVRQFAQEFVRRAEPYRPLYAMLNTTPLAAFDNLMRSAAILYQGDPRMKAKVVADLIRERGIDPSAVADFIDGVDAGGQPVPQPDPHVRQLTETVQTLASRLDQQAKADQERAQALADQHVANWAKDKPWFSDVRKRMAMLQQAANQEGLELTLDQAYATAISMDPEISKLEAQRKKALAVKANKANIDKARRAASSPRPSPARRPAGTPTGDRKRDVETAWEESEGRVAS